jgi:hypothetical protein
LLPCCGNRLFERSAYVSCVTGGPLLRASSLEFWTTYELTSRDVQRPPWPSPDILYGIFLSDATSSILIGDNVLHVFDSWPLWDVALRANVHPLRTSEIKSCADKEHFKNARLRMLVQKYHKTNCMHVSGDDWRKNSRLRFAIGWTLYHHDNCFMVWQRTLNRSAIMKMRQ